MTLFNLRYEKITYGYRQAEIKIQAIFTVLWLVNAANFNQIEYLVKRRLISANSISSKPGSSTSNLDSDLEVELNRLRGEMGLTQMKAKSKSSNIRRGTCAKSR